jgi:ATP-dependent Clp protease ATP-binding subunit ClpC
MDSKFYINLKKTIIYKAIILDKFFKIVDFFKKLFFILFLLFFLLFLFTTNQILLGMTLIFLVLFIFCWLKLFFFNSKLKKFKTKTTIEKILIEPEKYNLAEFLSFEVAKAINGSTKFAKRKNFFEINSTILFYFLLQNNQKLNFIFSRALLNIKGIKNTLKEHFKIYQNFYKNKINFKFNFSKDFQNTIFEALKIANEKKHQKIEIGDLLIALAKHNLIFQEIINNSDIKIEDIEHLTQWLESLEEKIEQRKKFWLWENLIKKGTLAKEWTSGFTITLDKFSIDLSEMAKKGVFDQAVGHEKEIEIIERILSRPDSNNDVLLIGEPGIGKKSIIQRLALKSVLGKTLPELNYKRIVALDIPLILTQTKNQKEVEIVLNKIFQEIAMSDNVILTINDFHNFVRTDIQPGIIDITGILSSYLALTQFQLIAITTYAGLHKYIERKPAILEFFEKVEVSEISEQETLLLLEKLTLFYEQKYKKFISYSALKKIIFLANRYIQNIPFPKKAIGLLGEAMVYVSSTKDKIVLPEHIEKIVSEKIQIPVGNIENKEKEILLNLEKLIHERIVNQVEAVREISAALRRARTEIQQLKGPMGTFLFLGPSGVGKTETAKALAEIYFSSEKKMIRMDMSEFQNTTDIPRLIGSVDEDGLLTTQVRENPFSIILLDEIEKAHKNILNLFLQVLDEGHLTDGLSRKINFQNTIIIATSNAGSQIILEALKQKSDWSELKEKLLDYVFEKEIFRPEFINRFDAVVIFQPLTKENLLAIVELMLQKIKKNLKNKNINFIISELLKEKIVELGYNPTFGARELKRVVQDKIENLLASAFLSDELKKGNKIEIIVEDDKFKMKIE